MRSKLFSSAILGLLVLAPLAASQVALADEENFQSFNYSNRVMRHRNFLMYIERQVGTLAINDSAFNVQKGLAGSCSSFQSRNFPGFFIRHQNYRLKISKYENTELFRRDATFCIGPGLADANASSFESFNYHGHFMRHSNFELSIQQSDGSVLFKKDATFIRRRAAISLEGDTEGVPVSE
jgi:hypothetical protein